MIETELGRDQALQGLLSNKQQCLKALENLAKAAVSRDGRFSLYVNANGGLFVTEDVSGGHGEVAPNNDICIYITDSSYKAMISTLIDDSKVWHDIFNKIVANLRSDGEYKPYVLCSDKFDIGLIAEVLKRQREAERAELKIYTSEQMFTKENIEYVFKDTGMENVAKDEYRKNAFSFDYIARDRVTFSGDKSVNFWALFLMSRTTFFINALMDKPHGVEFDFSYLFGDE